MKLIFFFILFFSLKVSATNYYWSSTGADGNDGSVGTPFQTIGKFNSFFSSLSPGDSALFKRGDTFIGSINFSRSGSIGNNIIVGAYGTGAAPKITSFVALTSWTSLGGGLYEKTLSSPPAISLNMVLLDGAFQPIGRYPKDGLGNSSYFTVSAFTTDSSRWENSNGTITSTGISAIPSFVGGEMVHKPYQWILNRSTVTAQTSTIVTYAASTPPWGAPNFTYKPTVGNGFFFQNHINALTTLGDWCYDQATKKITMFFGAGNPTTHTIQVATLDSLVQVKGVRSYITIRDLELNGSNENGINLDSATNISFNNLTVKFIGYNGINSHTSGNTTHHITIDGCDFNTILNNGIDAGTSASWTVTNNHVHNVGMTGGMGGTGDGMYIGMFWIGASSLVEYNHVDSIGYTGIYFTGSTITIQHNEVNNFCMTKADGGGIYTFGASGTGRIIQNNIVHDGFGNYYGLGYSDPNNAFNAAVHGIYMDGGVTGVDVLNNTSFKNSYSGLLINNSNSGITATGNTLYNNTYTQIVFSTPLTSVVSKHNILFAKDSSGLCMIGSISAGLTSDSNYFCRPMWEPNGINSNGFTTPPISFQTYTDGGVVFAPDSKYKSLNIWQSYSSKDANSVKTYTTTTDTSKIRFEYNATNATVVVSLGSYSYTGITGTTYSYSVSLSPYSSIILLNPVAISSNGQLRIPRKVKIF